jgi:acetyltransferase-like isoleucine patch superfamily enzyme
MRKIKIQGFLIALFLFNLIYRISFFWTLRRALLLITGSEIPNKCSIQAVRFLGFGKLSVGTKTVINSGCYLDVRRGITIGSNVVIAHDTKIYTLGHDYNDAAFKTKGKPVRIEDFAVLFSNVLVMPGVTIGKGAVILPGAVVTKDIPEMSIAGGNPAKVIRHRESVHHEKQLYNYWFAI